MGQRLVPKPRPANMTDMQAFLQTATPEQIARFQQLLGPAGQGLDDLRSKTADFKKNESLEVTGKASQEAGAKAKETQALGTREWLEALQNVNKYPTRSMKRLRSDVDKLRGLTMNEIDQYKNLQQVGGLMNFSPLASLTDAWTGTNFSKSYQNPEQVARANVLGLTDRLANAYGTLTKAEEDLMNMQLKDYFQTQQGLSTGLQGTYGRQEPGAAGINPLSAERLRMAKEKVDEDAQADAFQYVRDTNEEYGPLFSNLQTLESILSKYGDDITHTKIPEGIPFIGGKTYRRFDFQNWLEGGEKGEDARLIDQTLEDIVAEIRTRRIGSAQTRQEMANFAKAIGNRKFDSPKQLRDFLRKVDQLYRRGLQEEYQTMPSKMRSAYDESIPKEDQMRSRFGGRQFGGGDVKPVSPNAPAPSGDDVNKSLLDLLDEVEGKKGK